MEDRHQRSTQQNQPQTNSDPADNYSQKVEPLPPGWFHTPTRNRKRRAVYLSTSARERSFSLMQTIGYGLLLLALFDYAQILIPPQFTNYTWEMRAIAQLVERVPVPLIGLALVLYRPEAEIDKRELYLLRWLSRFSLGLGIFYLLMIPLAIQNTQRIYRANNNQIDERIARQVQQLQPIKEQLKNAKNDEQVEKLIATINRRNAPLIIEDPQAIKNELLTGIAQTEKRLQTQAETWRSDRRRTLIKNSVKWNLGALVSGVLFIRIWSLTRWVRTRHRL